MNLDLETIFVADVLPFAKCVHSRTLCALQLLFIEVVLTCGMMSQAVIRWRRRCPKEVFKSASETSHQEIPICVAVRATVFAK